MSLFRSEVAQHRRERLHGEVVLTQPLSVRWTAYVIFLSVALAVGWLTTGTYARIETVPGILTTSIPSTKIVAPVPGIVTSLHVAEGTSVQKGQTLAVIRLDRTSVSGAEVAARSLSALGARREIAESQVGLSRERVAVEKHRLAAAAASFENQARELQEQMALQRQAIASNQLLFERLTQVVQQGYVSQVEFERRRQSLIASRQALAGLEQQRAAKLAEAQQARAQMASLDVEAAQGVSELRSNMEALRQQEAQAEGEQAYVITAPIAGRVTAVQTAEGRTATSEIPLMMIVPAGSDLRAQLYAPTRAVGFVRPGQETRLLYDAFPYQRFGSFGGRVEAVSTMVIDPRETEVPIRLEEPVYRIDVRLDRQAIDARGQPVPLQPGMTLQANVVLERQSFMAWLLKPLYAVMRRDS